VSRLQQNVERARPLLREPITHADASMDFHVELARAAGNEVLYATVEAYRELLVPSIRDVRDEKSGRATQRAHEEIVEAVRAERTVGRDAVAAPMTGDTASPMSEARGRALVEHLAQAAGSPSSRPTTRSSAQGEALLRRIDQLASEADSLERELGLQRDSASRATVADLARRLRDARGDYEAVAAEAADDRTPTAALPARPARRAWAAQRRVSQRLRPGPERV